MSGGKWNVLGIASARRGGLTFAACGAGAYSPKGESLRRSLRLLLIGAGREGTDGPRKRSSMTQDERWNIWYDEVKSFVEENHRNPSKYVDSERGLRNWVKQQKKLMNAGAMEGWRLKMFEEVIGAGERDRRGNQWG